ncbi:MAG: hypothetical protein WCN27_00315 [Alphaproteobacteria bacterium]
MQPQQRSFTQFSDPGVGNSTSKFANIFNLKRANHSANLPSTAPNFQAAPQSPQWNPQFQGRTFQSPLPNYQSPPPAYQAGTNHNVQRNNFYNPTFNPAQQRTAINRSTKVKETMWNEFKRIYITEVLTFTMSKSTLFTLIFSFMFLGCVFFLSGFFTATSIYREKHNQNQIGKHIPSETAMLQGRPEKAVNMGQGINHTVPKNYQYQGGVKVNQNARKPSQYVEQQINSQQPYYQ